MRRRGGEPDLPHASLFRLRGDSVERDYAASRVRGGNAGILTTADHLLFTANDNGSLLALDPATGKIPWNAYGDGGSTTEPMTYKLDGRQCVILPSDSVVYALALPEKRQRIWGSKSSF